MTDRPIRLSSNLILAMMVVSAGAAAWALLPIEGPPTNDFVLFINPWMTAIRARGITSLAGDFSAYTPPYIYLLSIAAIIEPYVGTVAAVKLLNVPFVISCAVGSARIVGAATGHRERGKLAAAIIVVCPTLLLNSFAHGQCDIIFSSFLIWFVYFAIRERPVLACAMYGLAFSFKQEAIFLAPLLLALVLWRRMPIRFLLVIPATYVAMMIPAALAGRPWSELLTVYLGQASLNHVLSMNAPNPWWFLNRLVQYDVGVAIGILVGTTTGLVIALRSLRLMQTPSSILLVGALSSAAMPFVMPKMASRYFFVADLLCVVLACTQPALWPAAVLVQLGSLIAVSSYYYATWGPSGLASIPMTLGVCILAYQFIAAGRSERGDLRERIPNEPAA